MTLKRCPKCGIEKPVEAFSANRAKRDGRATYCKDCIRAINRGRNSKRRVITIRHDIKCISVWNARGEHRWISYRLYRKDEHAIGLMKLDGLVGWTVVEAK